MADFLHIYGQDNPHNPVFIIGSRQDLYNLMTTINKALYEPSQSEHYTSDGEGYYVNVIALKEPEYDKKHLMFPYSENYGCKEFSNKNKIGPYSVWRSMREYLGLKP